MAIRVAVFDQSPEAPALWDELFRRSDRVEFMGVYTGPFFPTGKKIPDAPPDVLMLSLRSPDRTLGIARSIYSDIPWCNMIVQGSADQSVIVSAARSGVRGFIPWNYGAEKILEVVHRVGDGEFYWPEEVKAALALFMLQLPSQITRREVDVLRLHVSQGLPQKRVAAMLNLNESTIEKHLAAARLKMGVPTNAMAWEEARKRACL